MPKWFNLFPRCVVYSQPVVDGGVQLGRVITRIDNPSAVDHRKLTSTITRIAEERSITIKPARHDIVS